MKTKSEILKAEKSGEVWRWIVDAAKRPEPVDQDVIAYFDQLRKDELRAAVGPNFDPAMHYDFF